MAGRDLETGAELLVVARIGLHWQYPSG